jgi:hypothetical protein
MLTKTPSGGSVDVNGGRVTAHLLDPDTSGIAPGGAELSAAEPS